VSEHEWAAGTIRWLERSPYLHEARVTTTDGADLYAGYVAVTPGADVWRGYVHRGFVPLGLGPLTRRMPCTHGGTRRRGCRCG